MKARDAGAQGDIEALRTVIAELFESVYLLPDGSTGGFEPGVKWEYPVAVAIPLQTSQTAA